MLRKNRYNLKTKEVKLADNLQRQRYEHKYIIREDVALAVRDFVSSYLEIDSFGATQPNLSYPVHSLYLDSPDMRLYQTTINGDKNRYKLRIRFYEDRPKAPVFFEIKRRTDNTISKQRGGIKREALDQVVSGQLPLPEHMASDDPGHRAAIEQFIHHMKELNASPKAHVAYYREAWISSGDNSVRVTMDRETRIEVEPTYRMITGINNPNYVFGNNIVLELKFTNRYPDWFRELVRIFGLAQCGAAKYVDGVTLIGESKVRMSLDANGYPVSMDGEIVKN
ncbi:MAG: hypothetical protein CBC27_05075 [Opitutia bacterium TMED67]|nr:hypothetical protein [Verrucomicrobiales bacterium]OUU72863.1 MAG: hypothetical protein CBC27_05075 [Opitutae bacterium TMED67]RZO60404.1 MAG: polyphosphate polymerase domain-containing protein [Limisphaerales bacterium]